MTTVRELITRVGFDVDSSGLNKANLSISNLKSSMLGITAFATAASASIYALLKTFASFSGELIKNAKDLGLTTKSLQEFTYAAERANVSSEEFTQGIRFFTRGIGNAARTGVADDFVNNLRRLGVSLTDANDNLRPTEDLLLDVADGLAKVTSETERNAVAAELFGRSGITLASFLSEGSASIEEMRKRANELNLVMGNDALKAGDKFDNKLKDLFATFRQIKNTLAEALLPIFTELIDTFLEWVSANRQLIQQNLTKVFNGITLVLQLLWVILKVVTKAFFALTSVVGGTENAVWLLVAAFTAIKVNALITAVKALTATFLSAALGVTSFQVALVAIPVAMAALGAFIAYLGIKLLDFLGITKFVLGESSDAWLDFKTVLLGLGIAGIIGAFLQPMYKLAALIGGLGKSLLAVTPGINLFGAALLIPVASIALMAIGIYKFVETIRSIDWGNIARLITEPLQNAANWIQEKFDNAANYITERWTALKNWFGTIRDNIRDIFDNFSWDNFVNNTIDAFKSVGKYIKETFNDAVDEASEKLDDLYEKFKKSKAYSYLSMPFKYISGEYDDKSEAKIGGLKQIANLIPAKIRFTFEDFSRANPNELARGGDTINNRSAKNNVTLNSNVVVNVPPGQVNSKPDEQSIANSVNKVLQEQFDRLLSQGLYNNTVLE